MSHDDNRRLRIVLAMSRACASSCDQALAQARCAASNAVALCCARGSTATSETLVWFSVSSHLKPGSWPCGDVTVNVKVTVNVH